MSDRDGGRDTMVELLRWNPATKRLESHGQYAASAALRALGEEDALASFDEPLRWSTPGAALHLTERIPHTVEHRIIHVGELSLSQTIFYREGGSSWSKLAYWNPARRRWHCIPHPIKE